MRRAKFSAKKLTIRAYHLAKDYAKQNGMPESLVGVCAISSVALYLALKVYGYKPKLQWGKTKRCINTGQTHHHVWVYLDDKVHDPTFQQFDEDSTIFIGPPTPYHEAFTEIVEVEKLDSFMTWDDKQMPTNERVMEFASKLIAVFQ